jgi:ubiquinone/menaquinone biosynthesis C-methylase UbiE
MRLFKRFGQTKSRAPSAGLANNGASLAALERDIAWHLKSNPDDRDLAFALAIGSPSLDLFRQQGDGHVAVLKSHGLADGMAIFDLGCGCGRTAQALHRSGWRGSYTGTDVVASFVEQLLVKCPGYAATVHRQPTLPAPDSSIDMVFHWSVFTHLSAEECYLYMADSFRAMKPGARMVFSFLELSDPAHQETFFRRARFLAQGQANPLLDTFLHRDWICFWAQTIGFSQPEFTDGWDGSRHAPFWQSLVAMTKPAG